MSDYFAVINDEVSGPHTIADLNGFSVDGHIHGDSAVRRVEDSDWSTWREILASRSPALVAGAPASPIASRNVLPRLSALREDTYYGLTRALLFWPFGLNSLGALALWFFFFQTPGDSEDALVRASHLDLLVLSISSSISSLGLLVAALVGRAIVDFADSELRRSTSGL